MRVSQAGSLVVWLMLGVGSSVGGPTSFYEEHFIRGSRSSRSRLCGPRLVDTLKHLCKDCYCVGGPRMKVKVGRRSVGQMELLERILRFPEPILPEDELERELRGLGGRRRKRGRVSPRVCCTRGCTYAQLNSMCGLKNDAACQCDA